MLCPDYFVSLAASVYIHVHDVLCIGHVCIAILFLLRILYNHVAMYQGQDGTQSLHLVVVCQAEEEGDQEDGMGIILYIRLI